VGEHFVLNDGGVLVDEDVFDCKRGDLGEEDSPESVCNGGVEAGEGEGSVMGLVCVKLYIEVLRISC
jgi:hypothetical protein